MNELMNEEQMAWLVAGLIFSSGKHAGYTGCVDDAFGLLDDVRAEMRERATAAELRAERGEPDKT